MATWQPLRDRLSNVDREITFTWAELEALVGTLPRSAYEYGAYWKGARTGWPGFTTRDVRVGDRITFVRRAARPGPGPASARPDVPDAVTAPPTVAPVDEGGTSDVILVGCVKSKLSVASAARDLYTSDLFRKERTYAEASGAPWFILSAQYGLVRPDAVIEPYELALKDTPAAYRRSWGTRVVEDLATALGHLSGRVIEIHAGSAYVDAIAPLLARAGAQVRLPLAGLSLGQRLSWYAGEARGPRDVRHGADSQPPPADVDAVVAQLRDERRTTGVRELVASRGAGLRSPGLYSWWVDAAGALTLSAGLGQTVDAGMIYVGLAGATRARSGRPSRNTLWGRISSMHLGGNADFSTLRKSLGSILAAATGAAVIDETALTDWMYRHLRVITVPVDDADTLAELETQVLTALDPPLNRSKVTMTPVRRRLKELRRAYARPTTPHA